MTLTLYTINGPLVAGVRRVESLTGMANALPHHW